jgi:FkbM family methyltransferase
MLSFILRVYFKLIRTANLKNIFFKIKKGPIKGLKLEIATSNNDFLSGEYEDTMIQEISAVINGDFSFIDMGANIGFMSICFSRFCKAVYAIEPIPEINKSLKKNIEVNNLSNVFTFQYAISNFNGEIEFSNSPKIHGNTYIQDSYLFKKINDKIRVKTITIDTFVLENKIKSPLILKIDVEGAEYDVLLGSEKTIDSLRPVIILATHDCHVEGVKDKCIKFLEAKNYTIQQTKDLKTTNDEIEDFICLPKQS